MRAVVLRAPAPRLKAPPRSDREVPLAVYSAKDDSGAEGDTVIVYVMNHGHERIGMEPDLLILSDYIQEGHIVITVDFQDDPGAISPDFDEDLHRIFRSVYGHEVEPLLDDIGLKASRYRCFFLPAGYRLVTDLVYWDRRKHGVHGTLEWTPGKMLALSASCAPDAALGSLPDGPLP